MTQSDNHILSLREKVSYGMGDFASSMFWKLFSMFLLFFYTDVFGISAAAVGTMFLVTRVWDAFNDPLMGIISDRTETKMGKFRPYLLYGAIPFAIIGVLTFSSPDLSSNGKLIYAYVTYTLMMMAYTAVNVPYASLMGVMTSNTDQRTTLASFRFIGAFTGGLFVTSTANYFVEMFSEMAGPDSGYQYTVAIYACLAAVLFIITALGTKERLKPAIAKPRLKEDLKDIAKNGPWFIMLGAAISVLIFNSLRDGSILYYFKYYVQDQAVTIFGSTYEFSHTTLSSAYLSVWLGSNILGVILAKPLAAKVGKKTAFQISVLSSAALSFIIYLLQPDQIGLLFLTNVLIGISAGIVLPLIWSMYADIADYSEWKTGRRATGLIFSSSSMSQKFGWTIGGALAGWILAAYGFEANVAQTDESLMGIRLMISVFAGVGALVASGFMFFYKLDEETVHEMEAQLEQQRNAEDNE